MMLSNITKNIAQYALAAAMLTTGFVKSAQAQEATPDFATIAFAAKQAAQEKAQADQDQADWLKESKKNATPLLESLRVLTKASGSKITVSERDDGDTVKINVKDKNDPFYLTLSVMGDSVNVNETPAEQDSTTYGVNNSIRNTHTNFSGDTQTENTNNVSSNVPISSNAPQGEIVDNDDSRTGALEQVVEDAIQHEWVTEAQIDAAIAKMQKRPKHSAEAQVQAQNPKGPGG